MGFIEELRWRGMVHDIMPGTEKLLNEGNTSGYIGFDPTADSLGVGNLVQVMTLVHFQRSGHMPIALVGGATGMIGDPSFKSQERQLLSVDQIQYNLECQKAQIERFLDFSPGSNAARVVNNYDWFKDFSFLDFVRDVGKHITVNYMLSKDSVQSRMETGISFTEFTYQLIQGYDFFWLYKHMGVRLQMGGSDQWGNITTGTELIRRLSGGEAFALTTPLIKKADGTKFGKTESGNIWLDPRKTSPYKFYQFWLNAADADAPQFIRIFSLRGKEEIESLEQQHLAAPHLRTLQRTLAEEITARVHGSDQLRRAIDASSILFGENTRHLLTDLTDEEVRDVFDGVPASTIPRDRFTEGIMLLDLLAESTAYPSKGEARKALAAGAVRLNKEKVQDGALLVRGEHLIRGNFLLLQSGKNKYFLVYAG